jgi:glycosyltransferase involved in cell wall biosynthesis
MITVSLCLIVRDEEASLPVCLRSVKELVDEIIVVDTGSLDDTVKIAHSFGATVVDFKWIDDFAAARNFAFEQATMEYILWLDADDVLMDQDREKFLTLKSTLTHDVDAVTMPYHLAFDEFGNVTTSLRRNRLVKRSRGFRWHGAVHEYLAVGGRVKDSDAAVTHRKVRSSSDRNLNIYESRLAQGETFSPRDLFYYANELSDHRQFEKAVEFYNRFLDTGQGWVEDNIAACGKLADCYSMLGQEEQEIAAALRSFQYDVPRAENCCRLGFRFMQREEWRRATYWYRTAAGLERPENSLGGMNLACWTWLPHLQLCVCYTRLGEYRLAYAHNETALAYRPTDERMLHNRRYLNTLLSGVSPENAPT